MGVTWTKGLCIPLGLCGSGSVIQDHQIMVHQRNLWIYSGQGFVVSFDALCSLYPILFLIWIIPKESTWRISDYPVQWLKSMWIVIPSNSWGLGEGIEQSRSSFSQFVWIIFAFLSQVSQAHFIIVEILLLSAACKYLSHTSSGAADSLHL